MVFSFIVIVWRLIRVADGTSINIKPSDMHVEGGDEKERQYKRRRG